MASTSDEYWDDIKKIFGLPDHTRKAVITFEAGKKVIAECYVYIDANSDATTAKRYKLIEIDETE